MKKATERSWISSFLGMGKRRAMVVLLDSGLCVKIQKPMVELFPQQVTITRGKGRSRINPMESAFAIELPTKEKDWKELKELVRTGRQKKIGRPFWHADKESSTVTGDRGGDFKVTEAEFVSMSKAVDDFEENWGK